MKRIVASVAVLVAACRPPVAPPTEPLHAPTSASVVASAGALDGRPWLEVDAATARAAGAGPLAVVASEPGADGDRVGAFVALPPDRCVLAYARGSHGIDDLDLLVFADDGAVIASDEAPDPRPSILSCPPHPARAYVSARVAAGRGLVAVGVQEVPVASAAAVGRALGARGRPGEEVGRAEIWPGLDEKVAARRKQTGGTWEEIRRVAVPLDARAPTRLSALLDPGRCLDVLVVPSDEVGQLEVALLDGDGRSIGRATTEGRERTAVACTPVQSPVSIELRPHAGQGLAAVVLARSAPGDASSLAPGLPVARLAPVSALAATRAERGKLLAALGLGEAKLVATSTAEVGRRSSHALDLPEGCARLDVVGGAPVAGVSAQLWDAAGALVADGESGDGPALFACGRGGKARVDLEATLRPGPVAVELRRDRQAPAALVSHPLAAARLLARLDVPGAPASAASAAHARAVALGATRLVAIDATVPAGRCLDVTAALDAGASGLDLRIEGARGEELAASRGRASGAARACAEGEPRPVRIELRVATGSADALVLSRETAPR